MGIFSRKTKQRVDKVSKIKSNLNIIDYKRVRDDLLKVLQDLQSGVFTRTLERNEYYRKHKKFIIDTNGGWWDSVERQNPYPTKSIAKLIDILNKVPDGDPETIDELASKESILNGDSLFYQAKFKKLDIRVFGLSAFYQDFWDDEDKEAIYIEAYDDIVDDLNVVAKDLEDKYKNSSVKINIDDAGSYFQVGINLNKVFPII